MFSLPNLVSKAVTVCEPWKFRSNTIPAGVRGKENKKARDTWINLPDTRHEVYSAYEGFDAGQRVSKPKAGDEGNPPLKLHAFVADIDAPVSESELAAAIERLGDWVPNYLERTLSGNARLIWLFERPIAFPNRRFCVEFLEYALTKIRFEQFPAFDKPAWVEPGRYWTNSGEWFTVSETNRVPFAVLNGWIVAVSEKHLWRKDRGAIDIPLPVVFREIEKKYSANAWPGEFVEGAPGPSFWIAESTSPKSAIVKPTGMFTFAAHAVKPFYSWADLLGAAFVDKYAAEAMGKAVEGILHDGKAYWRRDGFGSWKAFAKEDLIGHLSVDRGLSTVKDGGMPAEVSRAVQYIQNWQGIEGAAPFVFQPTGIIDRNGCKLLNTHTRRVLAPAGDAAIWGSAGNFPFVSQFFDGLFDPLEQLEYFLAWLARFYAGAYNFNLESGQNVFLLGEPGIGKTFLSQGLLPKLMGGSAEAEKYLLGETDFNSELFEVGLWTVDDNSVTVDASSHRKFSAMVKKMAANTTFSYHAKFRIPVTVNWMGRVFVTTNDDAESARIVPDLSISILDKLFLLRANAKPSIVFPSRSECTAILDRELPYLARWLLDYRIHPRLVGKSRFGILPYHEKRLMATAEQSSRSSGFMEILEDWRETYFRETQVASWEGSAFQLLKELHKDESMSRAAARSLSAEIIGRHLTNLQAKGYAFETAEKNGARRWKILRERQEPQNGTQAQPATPAVKSKFQK